MKRLVLISFIALTGIFGYLFLFARTGEAPRVATPDAIRKTTYGPVIGYQAENNTLGWRGVRYAASAAGNNRWRAPQPPKPWQETRTALDYDNICPQFWGPGTGIDGENGEIAGSEDCLFLNVWSPRMDQASAQKSRLPVMVWFHGGASTVGTANTYPGYNIAGSQQVVFVGVNYRLNTIGWFSHPALSATSANPEDASGNYGTLDMIASLKWVRDNIAEFGGDPDNVTIFGESAGGHAVYAMVASPLAKGLFHKAIVQSGMASSDQLFRAHNYTDDNPPGQENSSAEILVRQLIRDGRAADRQSAKTLASEMNAEETMSYLRGKSLDDLYAAFDAETGGFFQVPHHTRDGYVIPKEPWLKLFRNPEKYNAVPMIIGSNRDEGKLPVMIDPDYVELRFGFFPVVRNAEDHQRRADYISDAWKALSVDEPAAVLHQSQGDTVYTYRFEWDDWPYQWLAWLVDAKQLFGAIHALDISFVFGDIDGMAGMKIIRSDDNEAGRKGLQTAMMNYWGNFAWTGQPGSGRDGNQPLWRPWQFEGENIMILDALDQGNLGMKDLRITARSLKDRMLSDPQLQGQKALCGLYASLFLASHQIDDFFDEQEFQHLGQTGCADYNPWDFYSRNL